MFKNKQIEKQTKNQIKQKVNKIITYVKKKGLNKNKKIIIRIYCLTSFFKPRTSI